MSGRPSIAGIWILSELLTLSVRAAEIRPDEHVEAPAVPAIPFVEVTREAGVDFVHANGATGAKLLPETMGGGIALFDFDGDLDADLLLVNSWGGSEVQLYRNESPALGGGPIRFRRVTSEVGLDLPAADGAYGMGVAVGDIDADGDPDLFITSTGPDRLLRNDQTSGGGSRFTDVSAPAGVAGDASAWSTGASFFDADGDGDLDLLVVRYVTWSKAIDDALGFRLEGVGRAYGRPQEYAGTQPSLYLNRGDGTFDDATEGSGLEVFGAAGKPLAKSLAVLPVDANGDGRMDILVANDTVRNFFFRNLGPGKGATKPTQPHFEEVGEFYGLAYDRDGRATGAMGVDAGYYRNDANLGFLVGNYADETSSILRAQDDPEFYVDEAMKEGLGAPSRALLTFGVFFFDADLDGRLDVLHVNGHVEPDIAKIDAAQSYTQPGQLFWNAGDGFVLLPNAQVGDLAREVPGRGAAYADLDGDGDLDVVTTQIGGPARVLRNDQTLGHHWLRLRLEPEHRAIGAWLELKAGGNTQRRQVMPTRSYLSQVEPVVTFGLGTAEKVESLTLRWPDGTAQQIEVSGVDRLVAVQKPR